MAFIISVGVVAGILLIAGIIISLLSTALECGKTSVGTAFKQSAIYLGLPLVVYSAASYFPVIRNSYARTIKYFGVQDDDSAAVIAVGYLVLLSMCISAVPIINQSIKSVCQPDVNEMSEFKKKLEVELHNKQIKEEKDSQKK